MLFLRLKFSSKLISKSVPMYCYLQTKLNFKSRVADPKLLISDPDPTFQSIMDPDSDPNFR